jgi:TatD DNase family protein
MLSTPNHKYVAIGECGLDYDRFEYADKETQLKVFPRHFELTEQFGLPMYLHSRSTGGDFTRIIKENRHRFPSGVVHSFTGTAEEAKDFVDLDLYIGLNGCSLKTEENLEVVKTIPMDRIMLETDCPYCDIRNSHAGSKYVQTKFQKVDVKKYTPDKMVKDRNEPCSIVQVVEVLSAVLGIEPEELCEVAWRNTL